MSLPRLRRTTQPVGKSKVGSGHYSVGIPGFLQWVQETHPQVWKASQYSPALSGLGAAEDAAIASAGATTAQPGTLAKIVAGVTDAAAKLLPLYQQQQEFKTQLTRAQSGLAPLDLADYTGNTGYRVGVTADTSKTAIILVGLGVAGLLGFALLRGHSGAKRK